MQALATYRELKADDLLTMMVPHQPLYPLSKIHVPVFLQPQPGQNVAVFIVRWACERAFFASRTAVESRELIKWRKYNWPDERAANVNLRWFPSWNGLSLMFVLLQMPLQRSFTIWINLKLQKPWGVISTNYRLWRLPSMCANFSLIAHLWRWASELITVLCANALNHHTPWPYIIIDIHIRTCFSPFDCVRLTDSLIVCECVKMTIIASIKSTISFFNIYVMWAPFILCFYTTTYYILLLSRIHTIRLSSSVINLYGSVSINIMNCVKSHSLLLSVSGSKLPYNILHKWPHLYKRKSSNGVGESKGR